MKTIEDSTTQIADSSRGAAWGLFVDIMPVPGIDGVIVSVILTYHAVFHIISKSSCAWDIHFVEKLNVIKRKVLIFDLHGTIRWSLFWVFHNITCLIILMITALMQHEIICYIWQYKYM